MSHLTRECLVDSFGPYELTPQHQRIVFDAALGNFQTRYDILLQEVRSLDPKVQGFEAHELLNEAGEAGLEPTSYANVVKFLNIMTPAYAKLKALRRELVESGGGLYMDQAAEMLNKLNELDEPNKHPFTEDLYIPPTIPTKEPATTGASLGVR